MPAFNDQEDPCFVETFRFWRLEAREVELPWGIFVTAFERYAVRTFEAQALDTF